MGNLTLIYLSLAKANIQKPVWVLRKKYLCFFLIYINICQNLSSPFPRFISPQTMSLRVSLLQHGSLMTAVPQGCPCAGMTSVAFLISFIFSVTQGLISPLLLTCISKETANDFSSHAVGHHFLSTGSFIG